jgi:hypothetical protein
MYVQHSYEYLSLTQNGDFVWEGVAEEGETVGEILPFVFSCSGKPDFLLHKSCLFELNPTRIHGDLKEE